VFGSYTPPTIARGDSMLDNLRNLRLLNLGEDGPKRGLAHDVVRAHGVLKVVREGIFEGHFKGGLN